MRVVRKRPVSLGSGKMLISPEVKGFRPPARYQSVRHESPARPRSAALSLRREPADSLCRPSLARRRAKLEQKVVGCAVCRAPIHKSGSTTRSKKSASKSYVINSAFSYPGSRQKSRGFNLHLGFRHRDRAFIDVLAARCEPYL